VCTTTILKAASDIDRTHTIRDLSEDGSPVGSDAQNLSEKWCSATIVADGCSWLT
jgi:hypothetical protein